MPGPKSADYRAINPWRSSSADRWLLPSRIWRHLRLCSRVAPQVALAPPLGDPARGRYCNGCFFSPVVLSPLSHKVRQYSGPARMGVLVISTGFSMCGGSRHQGPGCSASFLGGRLMRARSSFRDRYFQACSTRRYCVPMWTAASPVSAPAPRRLKPPAFECTGVESGFGCDYIQKPLSFTFD